MISQMQSALAESLGAFKPLVALVLGSGWGALAERCRIKRTVSFLDIPELGATSVPGHQGKLLLGTWAGVPVLLFAGRLHYYEGHSRRRIAEMACFARELGTEILVLTNSAGGIRPDLSTGSLMALTGHLSLIGADAWKRIADTESIAVVDSPYCDELRQTLIAAGRDCDVAVAEGVYAQVTGPTYETPAEVRAFGKCGADAVGMSTGLESEAAHALGMRCLGLSCITNCAAGLATGPLHHDEVLTVARERTERMGDLLEGFLKRLAAFVSERSVQ